MENETKKIVSEESAIELHSLEDDLQKCIDIVEKCIASSDWIECDNPKILQLGFAKMAQLDSDDESERVYLRLGKMKEMQRFDSNFSQVYEKWVINRWVSRRKSRSAMFFSRYQ